MEDHMSRIEIIAHSTIIRMIRWLLRAKIILGKAAFILWSLLNMLAAAAAAGMRHGNISL
jgi:hypothetical protein